ncbi:MAG: F0F1 ATP synthase subunit A [Verrucomicrobiae bacterium]|nr:F0F1 ATP synthase subunit A [Verrucomicrobiae bacterium]MCX7722749.1 F0F1 ATP synthase subunit A [Verrucomicrobiae bacterium]MDW7981150.1 F0F1 ATP synthase subunit A [Verrucomicrobiales bacterium]
MRLRKLTSVLIGLVALLACAHLVLGVGAATDAAPGASEPVAGAVHAAHQAHRLPQAAPVLFRLGPFPVTNSMVVSWVVALGLIAFARIATARMQEVPSGAQNFLEWLVEMLYSFLESLIGPALVRRTFWFFATVFIFILSANWAGLLPGLGTIGWGTRTEHGFVIERPLFRGANADLNMTFALAMAFFACWLVWALRENGVKGFVLHLFGPKGDVTGLLRVLLIGVFVFVGLLEVVSILFRPVSLSFRLYGNIFAGENLLENMLQAAPPLLSWIVAVPFYFLELLVGLIQALVFMLLTAVFTMLICTHEDSEPGAQH